MPTSQKILVIGSSGQIGTELVEGLRLSFGTEAVVASDIKEPKIAGTGPFEKLNVLDRQELEAIVKKYGITQIYLLAALLSATAEQNIKFAWQLNMDGLFNVLDLARERNIRIFWPSSIAVFGPGTPRKNTPQSCFMDPSTVYGISKLAGERWCEYYFLKYGLDIRSIRYPGLIGYKSPPGGGTTDYAVDIFHQAVKTRQYTCFLSEDSVLPMMYMPDAIRATVQLMEAPFEQIRVRSSYNVAGFSFSPKELADEIKKTIPDFVCNYKPDHRQLIASSWPQSIDDHEAKNDWKWKPEYDLQRMTRDMLTNIN